MSAHVFESTFASGCQDEQTTRALINASQRDNSISSFFIRDGGRLEVKAGAETHLPRLMTPRGIPVGVLKAGSSFSPSSITLFLKTWTEKKTATWLLDTYSTCVHVRQLIQVKRRITVAG